MRLVASLLFVAASLFGLSSASAQDVIKIGADGHPLAMIGGRGNGPGEFVGPKGVAIDASSGKVYVADTGNARVQRLSLDGSPDTSWPMPPLPPST